MAVNYSSKLPQDRNNAVMTGISTPFPALAATTVENGTVSSVTAFNANATMIEIAAVNTAVAIKWTTKANLSATSSVITTVAGANYDNVIPSGTVRTFVIPRATQGVGASSIGGIAGLNTDEGLYNAIAIKTTGISSVLMTQY